MAAASINGKLGLSGGKKLKRYLRKTKQNKRETLQVGFFSTARYPPVRAGKNGGQKQHPHHVATVAAWNEFGTKTIPERPFFRHFVDELPRSVEFKLALIQHNPQVYDVKNARWVEHGFDRLGAVAAGMLQDSIRELDDPPNAPTTVKRKKSSNPLIDTGLLRLSATWRMRQV